MAARILNGNQIRDEIYSELRADIEQLRATGIMPGLATVLVGENPHRKCTSAARLPLASSWGWSVLITLRLLPRRRTNFLRWCAHLNANDAVDGILIQLPLPSQVDAKRVLESVNPAKDVDGFHPMNLGHLVTGQPGLVACTPSGVMEILRRSGIAVEGANAVVVGRSDIVGKPMALLLLHGNATVTVCHSKTRDLPDVIRRGDIVVAAMGRPGMIAADWIKPGATVIDVGTTRVTSAEQANQFFANFPERLAKFRERGFAVVGDVHPNAARVAGAITPVPGGVGPLTIAMLMSNTVKAARLRRVAAQTLPFEAARH